MKTNYNKHTKQVWFRSKFGTIAYVLEAHERDGVVIPLQPIKPQEA